MFRLMPGFLLSVVLSFIAIAISHLPFPPFTVRGAVPHPIEPLIIAIILGMLIGNLTTLPRLFSSGVNFSTKHLLPIAIVLMGVQLQLHQLWVISSFSLIINIICIIAALIATVIFAHWLKVETTLTKLIGIGTAICGSSAILACAPIIAADVSAIILSIAAINLFGTLAIFIFPLLGHWLDLSDLQYGIFAGTSIQAIPQVVAGGFAFNAQAGQIGVIVKLVRIILLVPIMLGLAVLQRKEQPNQTQQAWYRYFPPMVIGFLIVAILNAFGVFKPITISNHVVEIKQLLTVCSNFFIIITMTAIGLMTNIKQLISASSKAMTLALLSMLTLMGISLGLIFTLL